MHACATCTHANKAINTLNISTDYTINEVGSSTGS